jgi:uncharacterized protein
MVAYWKWVWLTSIVLLVCGGIAVIAPTTTEVGIIPTTGAQTTRNNHLGDSRPGANRLGDERSPYLRQHADNPVHWQAWGEEAFEQARDEDKPIFLSIGYSTCHWCHVMEHESFEDPQVAGVLNEHYISIKVDREERPDIDEVYMTALHTMGQRGGWPLTIIMTPDKRPFFGGTYFPRHPRGGMPGIINVLSGIASTWQADRARIEQVASGLMDATIDNAIHVSGGGGVIDEEVSRRAFVSLSDEFDEEWGGFGLEPKFPTPTNLRFLLRYWYRTKEPRALEMVETTLRQMALGGIYDHLGGGFARYSVDRYWRVPHFEKMLYDNAQLVQVYLEAYQITHDRLYARVAEETLDYVLREMSGPDGAFATATDADSEGEEGKYFVWRPEQIEEILGEEDGRLFSRYYHVKEEGNFENGTSVLYVTETIEEFAKEMGLPASEISRTLESGRQRLLQARGDRIPPLRDEKVLAAWNGLMISAFTQGYMVLGKENYRDAAISAAKTIREHMVEGDTLHRRWMEGDLSGPGFLDDYSYMANAALDVYEVTFDLAWLRWAISLGDALNERFWDEEHGGYYYSDNTTSDLPVRSKSAYDGAMPSGNAMAAKLMLRLAEFTSDTRWRVYADSVFAVFGDQILANPTAFTQMMSDLEFVLVGPYEIVFAGNRDDPNFERLHLGLGRIYAPHRVIALAEGAEAEALAPMLSGRPAIGGEATVYVCLNYTCKLPVTTVEAMVAQLTAPSAMPSAADPE